MTIGTTPFQYPTKQQPANRIQIQPGQYYYQFRLREASAIFNASWLRDLDCLLVISEITSTLYPGDVVRSLHTVKTAQRNKPCQMGLTKNLTDWLPARATDSCTITIKYIGIQSSPIKDFLAHIEKSGLDAVVSALAPKWEVALKVSDIVGKAISYLLQEGSPQELFSVTQQFNINSLQTGYYAALGCTKDSDLSFHLFLDSQQRLFYEKDRKPVENLSYAILEVAALKVVRQEPWWQILESVKNEIIRECDLTTELALERVNELKRRWYDTLSLVEKLTCQDRGYILAEVKDILRLFSDEVLRKLRSPKTLQSFGSDSIPSSWQHLLQVSTSKELHQCAIDYQYELQWSQDQRNAQ
jgi:hypothetical protein